MERYQAWTGEENGLFIKLKKNRGEEKDINQEQANKIEEVSKNMVEWLNS